MFNPETANVIPGMNAIVINRARVGDTWIWLCERNCGYQRYVTWVSDVHCADKMDWGHYFGRFVNAYRDFQGRIKEQCELVSTYA